MTSEPLYDATKPITMKIGEQDRIAVQCSPSRCVVANRAGRLSGVDDQRIGAKGARLHRSDGWHRYDLDPDTAAAIRAYDRAGEVMPAGFRVTLLPPARPLGARAGEKPGSNKRSGKGESTATRRKSTRSMFVEPPKP